MELDFHTHNFKHNFRATVKLLREFRKLKMIFMTSSLIFGHLDSFSVNNNFYENVSKAQNQLKKDIQNEK